MDIKKLSDDILSETEKIIVGKTDCIRKVIMAVLSGGHVLLNDLPGVGKTTLVKTLSKATGCDYRRIQFVSDMLPSDIIGMNIFNQKSGDFELRKGPVMTNILLADEINRAIPRTQSALLEAMEEHQITIDGNTFPLPSPFIVLATENPVEAESTFHLPVAQMDRFLISLSIGYPGQEEEIRMLKIVGDEIPFESVRAVSDSNMIIQAQRECRKVHVSDAINSYIVKITNGTRNDPRLRMGASPRASRALYQASKAWAAMNGRSFVTPDDVKDIVYDVLVHRMTLEESAEFSGLTVRQVLSQILDNIEASISAKDEVNA
ncbi:MAG TPA: MoxR family ATPase [Candidatus Ornithospirochaeta stercorigallinarum]|nr:MoxR family ATPase [Candidatus Ornithospirochaeta stercorigallinarum]